VIPKIFGTVGLFFDIIGAFLVAIEVVKVYRGSLTRGILNDTWADSSKPAPEYVQFEKQKHRWMKAGLIFLVSGFIMQIIAIWIK